MVVEFAPVEFHGDCSSRNSNRDEHRAQENDMVVTVSVSDSAGHTGCIYALIGAEQALK